MAKKKTAMKKSTKKSTKKASAKRSSKCPIDMSFLEEEPWVDKNGKSMTGKTYEELVDTIETIWETEYLIRKASADADPEQFEQYVIQLFTDKMRMALASQGAAGKGVILGASRPFCPRTAMRGKAMREYQANKRKAVDDGFVSITRKKGGGVIVTPLYYKMGRDNYGEPIEGTAWNFDVFGAWSPEENGKVGKLKPFNVRIGGMYNDHLAAAKCPACGNVDYHEICTKCGADKPDFVLPTVMESMFQRVSLGLQIKQTDKGVAVRWSKSTEPKPLQNGGMNSDDLLKLLEKPAFKKHKITSQNYKKTWERHKKEFGYWVWMRGTISRIIGEPDKMGNRKIYLTDRFLPLFVPGTTRPSIGVPVKVPEHVWNYQLRDSYAKGSSVVVTGSLDSYTYTNNDGEEIRNYTIEAAGIFGIDGFTTKPPADDGKQLAPETPKTVEEVFDDDEESFDDGSEEDLDEENVEEEFEESDEEIDW